ncbi:epidermal growth factor receptor substrate 15-like 1 isoform X3 [Anolis sagrei]|uniref:epidermal growth factor receptor substrate 15-like 1 isoform X3 n=1 Tax=Anolis sagrei TaxID=38937 RepID=UPI00351FD50B
MAALGSLGGGSAAQLTSGTPLYETFYKQVDPSGTGRVGASDAALFLKQSGLPDAILGKIWDLADPEGKGFLDKQGFFVALRLVACAQSGNDVGPASLGLTLPPPKFHDSTSPLLLPPSSEAHWAVRVEERAKFDGIFESLLPVNGLLSGDKVKPVLINSKLPLDVLGRVWDLSDIDKDGHLDRDEFAVAPSSNWVVLLSDKVRYDEIFLKTDLDQDGFVSGLEVKDIFMHSGLSQNLLAHIWALADTRQTGKLNKDQFALAMHFIQQKVSKGLDPPQALLPDMIPPSERTTPVQDSSSSVGSGEFTGVKELDDISQEIALLQREKYSLEQEIREREGAIRQKTSEVQELQNDLDREANGLQELEAQKQDAQGRLDEMDQQKSKLRDMLGDVRQKCQEENQVISSLKLQIQSQESDLQSQAEGIGQAKAELNRLQQEETQLGQSLQAGKVQLETIIKSLQSTQEEINQARSRLSQLQESHRESSRGLEPFPEGLNGIHQGGGSMTNLADLSEGLPPPQPKERPGFGALEDPFRNKALLFSGAGMGPPDLPPDPFHAEDPFKGSDPFQNDPFAEQPPAASDPFGGDPFEESDPFRAPAPEDFFKKAEKSDPFTSDPFLQNNPVLPSKPNFFENDDPFLSLSMASSKAPDPFGTLDAFGSSAFSGGGGSGGGGGGSEGFADFSRMSKPPAADPFSSSSAASFGGSAFPEDPFRSQADTPALPPKKNMPPRPKPPPSGKSPPVSQAGSSSLAKPPDPFQPFRPDTGDPFQSSKGFGDLFSGRDLFVAPPPPPPPPSSSSTSSSSSSTRKASKEPSRGFADFGTLGNEEQQLAWAKRESEKAERDRLARLRRQEQEDLELAIALSKADMPAS